MFDTARSRRRFLAWCTIALAGAFIGYFYVAIAYAPTSPEMGSPWGGARVGLALAAFTSGFDLFVLDSRPGSRLRQLPFLLLLAVRLAVFAAIILALLSLNILLARALGEGWARNAFAPRDFLQDVVVSVAVMFAIMFIFQMRALIGGRTLRNFVLGRYYKPVRENRVFLLVDLVGSTPLAARLGEERFHVYLSNLFFDLDAPIVDACGEVHSYVGDALIASWPLDDRENRERALQALADVFKLISEKAPIYQRLHGEAPRLRAALHVGPVVAGECGDSRRQITYLGQTLNALSRIELLAKELKVEAIASRAVVEDATLPASLTAVDLGSRQLAGFSEPLAVVALSPRAVG